MQIWLNHYQQAFWVIIPLVFVGWWLFLCALLSFIGGWTILATLFRSAAPFAGPLWKMQSAQMRFRTYYGNCLTIGANGEGLYLAAMPLFAFRHPALFIPWHEISVSRQQILFLRYVRFELGRDLNIPLRVREKLAEDIRQAAGQRWPVEQIAGIVG